MSNEMNSLPFHVDINTAATVLKNQFNINAKKNSACLDDLTDLCGLWFTDIQGFNQDNFCVDLMLVVTELAEACEADRQAQKADNANLPSEHIPEFSGREEELADVLVRIFHMGKKYNLRLGEAFIAKMEFNFTRPLKHGKRY